MKLLGRTTRPDDLDQCVAQVRDRFLYDETALRDLRRLWLAVITEDVGRSAVVFAPERPERVLAFGVSIAISKSRFDTIVAEAAPFIGRDLLDDWRSGKRALLDDASFAKANACGDLHVMVAHNGVDETLDPGFLAEALSSMSENFVAQHAGLNLEALVHEAFGVPKEHATDLGMELTPYAPAHEAALEGLPPHRKPILLTMTRAYARQHPGNLAMNQTFLRFTPPKCALSKIERRILRFAIEGVRDETLAEILRIAPSTLKKRWAAIYVAMERVIDRASVSEIGQRGPEARRHVLQYVRQHPEELHAYAN